MISLFLLIIGIAAGFFIANFFSGKKEGKEGLFKSIEFKAGKYIIHLHHWLVAFIFLIFLSLIGLHSYLLFGFLIGVMIQGLLYKDFYKIIYKNTILRNFILRIKNFLKL